MKKLILPLVLLALILSPKPTFAHSFGKLYTLPVPFWMYLYGGAAAIAVSFLIIGYFFNKTERVLTFPSIDLTRSKIVKSLVSGNFLPILKLLSVLLFILTVATGVFGNDFAGFNFNMTFFWILFVLGFTYLTALLGNIFSFLNPLKILTEFYERLSKKPLIGLTSYPNKLAYYPALIFYFLFIWVELFAETTPKSLSLFLLGYSVITLAGVIAFGKDAWFKYGEFFSVFFQLISKVSPIEMKNRRLYLRPPFVGVLKGSAEHFSLLLFIMFMLSSTAFDGFRPTVTSYELYYPTIHLLLVPLFGDYSYITYQTLSLLLSPFLFLLFYLALLYLANLITRSKTSLLETSLRFAFSLIPIALAYNLAHYYTLILTEGQNIFYLISDPFGLNWDLFGTAGYKPNPAVIDAAFTWNLQVAFILVGHIAGVYLAHLVALKVFPTHRKALLSQFPMLVLMIIYTMTGLWVLAQPILAFD